MINIPEPLKNSIYQHKYTMGNETSYRFSIKRDIVKDNIPCCDESEIINHVDGSPDTFGPVHYDLNIISLELTENNLRLVGFPIRNGMQCPRALYRFNVPIENDNFTFSSKNYLCYFNRHFIDKNFCVIAINYNINTKEISSAAHIATDETHFESMAIEIPKTIQTRILAYCDGFQSKKYRTSLLNAS